MKFLSDMLTHLTDAEIIETIAMLKSPAYANLSKIHSEYLEMLEGIAKTRKINS